MYVRAVAQVELDDARTVADVRVLESKLEHEHVTLEEERKHMTEPKDRLAFPQLEVASSNRRSNTAVRLEECVRALPYSASNRSSCACRRSLRTTGSRKHMIC